MTVRGKNLRDLLRVKRVERKKRVANLKSRGILGSKKKNVYVTFPE